LSTPSASLSRTEHRLGLARAALAGRVDGKLVDTSFVIDHDAR
jgi:hypothetical protein